MSELQNDPNTIELAADIMSALVSNNSVPIAELPALIGSVHDALNRVASGSTQEAVEEPKQPAVPIKKSVQPDYIVCLDDGKRFKSLKRHLRTTYNMTPDQYRAKWGLAHDYPMVAPNYAAARSELAKQMGLGARRRKTRNRSLCNRLPLQKDVVRRPPDRVNISDDQRRLSPPVAAFSR